MKHNTKLTLIVGFIAMAVLAAVAFAPMPVYAADGNAVEINTFNMNQYETFAYHSQLIAGYKAQGMAVTANPYRESVYRIEVLYGGRLSQAEIYYEALRVRQGLPRFSEMTFVAGGSQWKPVN